MKKSHIILLLSLLFLCPVAIQAQINLNSAEGQKVSKALDDAYKKANSQNSNSKSKNGNTGYGTGTASVPGTMNRSQGNATVNKYQRANTANVSSTNNSNPTVQLQGQAAKDLLNARKVSKAGADYANKGQFEAAYVSQYAAFEGALPDESKTKNWKAQDWENYYYGQVKTSYDKECMEMSSSLAEKAKQSFTKALEERTGIKDINLELDNYELRNVIQEGNAAKATQYVKDKMKKTLTDKGIRTDVANIVIDEGTSKEVSANVSNTVSKASKRKEELEKTKAQIRKRCKGECKLK